MITLYGFGNIFPEGRGETKDLRAQWALEETGLPYRVHALDHTGGELDSDAYSRISPFRQVPVIDDDGFVVAESAAVVLYVAEKAGKLIPGDFQGRTRVVQWCFAAVGTVEPYRGRLTRRLLSCSLARGKRDARRETHSSRTTSRGCSIKVVHLTDEKLPIDTAFSRCSFNEPRAPDRRTLSETLQTPMPAATKRSNMI